MELTRPNWGHKMIQSAYYRNAWLLSFLVLPFASYLSLVMLVLLMLMGLCIYPRRNLFVFWQQGFGLFSLGLLGSSALALHPGNAFLQLANFLLYATLPINALALGEYILKSPHLASTTSQWPLLTSWFAVNFGHRAHAMFDHPNGLSSYLVMILGLGLGLILYHTQTPKMVSRRQVGLTYLATLGCLVGIFCTGSRNGILIALVQLLVMGCFARRSRWLVLVGLTLVGTLVTSAVVLGVGGRELSLELMTQDPRVMVWQMAFSLIQQRPLLGWGLGGFSALYVPESIPGYPSIFHAHNLWLYLASEVGIPLMLGFSVIIAGFYWVSLRTLFSPQTTEQHRTLLIGYLLAFSGYLMFGLFDVVLFDSRIHAMSWLLLACMGILGKLKLPPLEPLNPKSE
jgi:O-antigen ligase